MTTFRRIIRPVVAAAAVLAIAAPAAQARPFIGSAGAAAPASQPTVIVRTTTDAGFSWTDAGLGAASGLAAGIVALGGAMAVRGRRRVALSS